MSLPQGMPDTAKGKRQEAAAILAAVQRQLTLALALLEAAEVGSQ